MTSEERQPPAELVIWWCPDCNRQSAEPLRHHLLSATRWCTGQSRKLRYILLEAR